MPLNKHLPDVPRLPNPGLYELLQAMRRLQTDTAKQVDAIVDGGAGGGGGVRDPPSFVLDFNSNFADFAASDAQDMYIRAGEYITASPLSDFEGKHAHGRGLIIGPTYAAPSNVGYMTEKPTTWPVQGVNGWFRGDQWFTDGGEWKTIGPLVRTYDIAARYFESNTIPHHAWLDVLSGNSGVAAYITAGVTPGNSVTLTYNGDQEWVGKQVVIRQSFNGAALATLTVASVAGQVVTFTTSHSVTCAWNPASGLAPNLSFALRTWAGQNYTLVRAGGGGDNYGEIVRINVSYQPKQNELVHTFNAMTAGQYGGAVDFITFTNTLTADASLVSTTVNVTPAPNSSIIGKRAAIKPWVGGPVIDYRRVASITPTSITFETAPSVAHPAGSVVVVGPEGCYSTGWESQFADGGSDVAVIGQVDSFTRLNDRADHGGRTWIGTLRQSSGRPSDAVFVGAGPWRRGLDVSRVSLTEGSYMVLAASAGATAVSVKWPSGARKDGLIQISYGATTFTGTITNVSGTTITFTPGLSAAFPANSRVDFPGGGSAIHMALGQWMNWDGSASTTGRGSDPLGIHPPLFGNETGIIWSGTANDGTPYWQTHVGDGRIRLRAASFNANVPIQGAQTVSAGQDLISLSSTISGNFTGAVVLGSGNYVSFNSVTSKFEFYRANTLVGSIPP